ncbi:MAG: methylated-DNA--[protein]-cysteine S-methyltransferase [Waddliaceae bacterium]
MFRHNNHYTQLPKIRVDFIFKDDLITRIQLSNAEAFSINSEHPQVLKWVDAYLRREEMPSLPLCFNGMTPFTQKVLKTLMETKEPISYSELARKAGHPNAQRAVGGVMNHNPFPLVIPCHRVITSTGDIGGYAYGIELKRHLLQFEGFFL